VGATEGTTNSAGGGCEGGLDSGNMDSSRAASTPKCERGKNAKQTAGGKIATDKEGIAGGRAARFPGDKREKKNPYLKFRGVRAGPFSRAEVNEIRPASNQGGPHRHKDEG